MGLKPANFRQRLFLLLLGLLFLSPLRLVSVQADDPAWSAPAFQVDAGTLQKATASLVAPEGTPTIVALDETRFTFQADGRRTYIRRMIYRILTQAGADGWATVSASWEPWHEQKPTIRARVISAAGKETWLDQKTLTDGGSGEQEDRVFSDGREITGPLPAMAPGVVVEEVIQIEETAPVFTNGVVHRVYFGRGVPTEQTRLVVDSPASLPIRWVVRGMNIEPQRTSSGDRATLTFTSGRIEEVEDAEPLAPPVPPHWPQVILSDGRSWQEVAKVYHQQVEEQLRGADVSSLVSPQIKSTPRKEAIEKIIRAMHQDVRYTGVEYGDASLIPRKPAETLQRKYGDCKDKAALLIAMLRAAGHPAYLALLKTSDSAETEPDLPGLGSFDHAIVYVPGIPEYWIDATDDSSRLGELPQMDQDRLALIIRPETTALAHTPQSSSLDNRSLETREFILAERGPASVVEVTESFGSVESGYRSYYSGTEAKDIRKQLETYAKDTYLGDLARYQNPSPDDFSKPFQLRLEMEKARRGLTDETSAAVGIEVRGLISRLPNLEPETDEEGTSKKNTAAKRKTDLLLREPFRSEWNYRIVPPPGFRARTLPESKSLKLGPAILKQEFALGADGAVTAHLLFDTVKRRFTPEEAEALRAGAKELRAQQILILTFEQLGVAYLEAGKTREALEEYRRLIALHPKEALHQEQLARAYLKVGLGESARAVARKAVEIEPTAEAYNTLAWILQHDLIGRRFEPGYDREGAVAAYRKARELAPDDAAPLGNMAIVMERDLHGLPYTRGSRLADAIKEYEAAGDKLESIGLAVNYPVALFYAGRFQEMEEAVKKLDPKKFSALRNEFQVIARATSAGVAAAIQFADREIPEDDARRKALSGAGSDLLRVRYYKESAELLKAGARGTPQASDVSARASVIGNIQRLEQMKLDDKDPRTVARRLVALFTNPDATWEQMRALVSREGSKVDGAEERRQMDQALASFRASAKSANLPVNVMADIGLGAITLTAEGDDSRGYKVRTQAPAAGLSNQSFYVVKEDGEYRIVDTGQNPSEIGGEIVARIERNDLVAARQMLDWVREDLKTGGGDDALAGPVFPLFWNRGDDPDPARMRLAAAALLSAKRPADALPILESAQKTASEAERQRLDLALASTYQKLKKWNELTAVGQRLLQTQPTSETALRFALTGLTNERRFAEAEQVLQKRLARLPNDPEATRQLAQLASNQGQHEKAIRLLRSLVDSNRATASDLNGVAWEALVAGHVAPEDLQIAQRANLQTSQKDFSIMHTVASLQAELGQTAEAYAVIMKAIEAAELGEPNEACWYVFGRLAEQYGEIEAARLAYGKVKKPEGEVWPASNYSLAQRRLRGLQK